jgi:hypothetical protein
VSCSELGDAQVSRTRLRFILGDARGQEMGIGVSRRWLLSGEGAFTLPTSLPAARPVEGAAGRWGCG